jgi:hypothetical protein
VEVFIFEPSRCGGLLRGLLSVRVFISKSFVFSTFSRAPGQILHVLELLVLRYAPLTPLGCCS